MDIEQQIVDHYAVLRRVMADPAMQPLGEQATVNNPDNFQRIGGQYIATPERRALHKQWSQEIIQAAELKAPIKSDGHAVVMAGAPGIGKGTIQRDKLDNLPGYVECDPDKFKEKILEHEYRTGNLASLDTPLMKELKAQGVVFTPMEYSTLVHQESSMLSKQLQEQLQAERKNYIVDTVLKDVDSARDVMARLDRQDYTYVVVSVQGTAAESKAGIYGRWEYDFRQHLEGKNTLGGRPVPSEFANSTFPDPNGRSTTELAARWLAEHGEGVQQFTQYRRGVDLPEIAQQKIEGKLYDRVAQGETTHKKDAAPSKEGTRQRLAERLKNRAAEKKNDPKPDSPGNPDRSAGSPKR